MSLIKEFFFYWYSFISRPIQKTTGTKNLASRVLVEFQTASMISLSMGAWGLIGVFLLGGILKCDKITTLAFFKAFMFFYVLIIIFFIRYIAFGNQANYDRQIDEMPQEKQKQLRRKYTLLTEIPIMLCIVLGLYLGISESIKRESEAPRAGTAEVNHPEPTKERK